MEIFKKNYKSLLLILMLILGLVVGLVLIKNPKIFKSKASEESLNITAADGKKVEKVNGVFETTSDHITIGVGDLEGL